MDKKKKSPAKLRLEAIQKRDDLVAQRKKAKGKKAKDALTAKIMDAGAAARKQGDIMRAETGRVRGQGTRYIGPTGGALTFDDPKAVAARASRGLGDPTAYQAANIARMAGMEGATTAQKRQAFKDLWGEPGSDKYRRQQEIQRQQMAGTQPPVVPPVAPWLG